MTPLFALRSALVAGAAALSLAACSDARASGPSEGHHAMHHDYQKPGELVLSAEGKVSMAPDMVSLSAGVVSEAKTAQEALADNRRKMNGVVTALKDAGVKDEDIQTSNLNIGPVYGRYDETRGEQRITGYRASNQVTAIVRDLDGAGEAIDALIGAGGNTLNGITFGVSDTTDARNKARRAAMKTLMERAELYADAGGFEIGRILTLSESGGYRPQPMMAARAMAFDAMESATPVEAGLMDIEITVSATFEIVQ